MESNRQIDPMLMQRIMEDDDSEIRAELEQALDAELAKPEDEIDFELITELSETLCTINGISNVELGRRQEKCIARLFPKQNWQKHMVNKWIKPLVVCMVAASTLLLVASLQMRSLGVDLIPEIVEVADGSALLLLDGSRNAHLQPAQGQGDPLGIADDLEALGIPAFVPSYAPDGVEKDQCTFENSMNQSKISAWYNFDKGRFMFSATMVHDSESLDSAWGMPTETYQLKSQECNGIYMITLEEEDRYQAVFVVNHTRYHFFAYGVDFAVCRSIVQSIMTEPTSTTSSKKEEPDV